MKKVRDDTSETDDTPKTVPHQLNAKTPIHAANISPIICVHI